jgi:hypothetical protein
LREADFTEDPEILRSLSNTVVSRAVGEEKSTKARVSKTAAVREIMRLWREICAVQVTRPILFADLCESGAFAPDAGRREFSFQRWDELREVVRRDAPVDPGARFALLRRLWSGAQQRQELGLADSSYRRESSEQRRGEFSDVLFDLSHAPSQVENDTVSRTGRIRTGRRPVYDLQVEGNGNFFANEILVHNCYIIDDPEKDKREANPRPCSVSCVSGSTRS